MTPERSYSDLVKMADSITRQTGIIRRVKWNGFRYVIHNTGEVKQGAWGK